MIRMVRGWKALRMNEEGRLVSRCTHILVEITSAIGDYGNTT